MYSIIGATNKLPSTDALYVEASPAMSAPGGLAVAGYEDCHCDAHPFSFDCLAMSASVSVNRFLKEAFVNDIKELQEDGKMRPLLLTAGARLIGSYSSLVKDLTVDNVIVVKIGRQQREQL